MKKIMSLVVTCLMIVSLAAAVSAGEIIKTPTTVYKVGEKTPVIDGVYSADEGWGDPITTVTFDMTQQEGAYLSLCDANHPELLKDANLIPSKVDVYMRWDEKALYYCAVVVQEKRWNTIPGGEDGNIWKNDSIIFNITSQDDDADKTRAGVGINNDGEIVYSSFAMEGGTLGCDNFADWKVTRNEETKTTTYEIPFLWEEIMEDEKVPLEKGLRLRDLLMPTDEEGQENPVDFNLSGIENGKYKYWDITFSEDAAGSASTASASGSTPTVSDGTPTFSTNYQIPKASAAPTIDGVKSAGEWDNSLIMRVNGNSMYPGGMPESETPPDATFYYMWSEEGLYLFANVLDSTEPFIIHDPGDGSYNSGDGVQLNVYPDPDISGAAAGLIYFWSLVVNSEEAVSVGEHFIFSDGATGVDVPDVQAACTKDGFNYTIEAFFPASVWTESDPPLEFKDGTTFGMTNVLMEEYEGTQTLLCDSAWFNENNEINTYTFVPAAAAAEEAPAEPEVTYPASGTEGNAIIGTVIGNAEGWGGNADAGAAAAFDGNVATFFDPLGVGDGFCGIDAGESYILDKVVIMSRADWNARFKGAMIQGSNDGENWTTLWTSESEGTNPDWYTVTEFENNTGYSQFRYFNTSEHGDVAEVEFYGNPGKVEAAPGFATADEAVASIGKNAISGYEFVEGAEGAFGGEGPENLWDGDTATKLCTNTLPASSTAMLNGFYTIDGVAIALANDNAEYGRVPTEWTLAGSTDGENWEVITTGDDSMFVKDNGNYRYFAKSFDATPAYSYVKIDITGSTDDIVQISEVVLTGAEAAAPADQTIDQEAKSPNTFDFGIIAAAAAVASLVGFAVSKKKH